MENQNNQLWFNNVNILFTRNNFFDIIPLVDMNFDEKINAITRFCIYLSIILIVFTGNLNYLYIPLSVILLFYLVHIFKPNNSNKETFEDDIYKPLVTDSAEQITIETNKEDLSSCRKPTDDNPLMNMQITDYTEGDNRRACNVNNDKISKTIDKNFDDKLYLNTEVVYNTKFNQRDFYTMPNTRPSNDQGAFANWLYNTPVSCAQGDEQSLKQVRACSFNNKSINELSEL
jgi:hypothetical protein